MAKKTTTTKQNHTEPSWFAALKTFFTNERTRFITGLIISILTIYVGLALISFFFTGAADQSKIENVPLGDLLTNRGSVENWTGVRGAYLSDLLMNRWFGISSFMILFFLGSVGAKLMNLNKVSLLRRFLFSASALIWGSVFFAFIFIKGYEDTFIYLGGQHGYYISEMFITNIGIPGTILLLLGSFLIIAIFTSKKTIPFLQRMFSLGWVKNRLKREGREDEVEVDQTEKEDIVIPRSKPVVEQPDEQPEMNDYEEFDTEAELLEAEGKENRKTVPEYEEEEVAADDDLVVTIAKGDDDPINEKTEEINTPELGDEEDAGFTVEVAAGNDETYDASALGTYDPRLDLSRYVFPTLDLLKAYDSGSMEINRDELAENQRLIKQALEDFNIKIASIKATVGPTVTLYEIVPEAGVRISKIKNLEDDIALSLSALQIRIIAPMPGKGTIGIEVPNKNPQTVSMQSVIASRRFVEGKYELPVAMGKTITNEVFMFDLCKTPHLLVAGATGQGKSVGLNAIITSLLYKKHPSELKFVMVDPKMVEFSIYSKIERHYLAKLPNAEKPIVTEPADAVATLNSLVIEMEDRYRLLVNANVRNIKEYNAKFIERRLNPQKGHRFLPYIVAVVDEFADLIAVAGREIELPISRIAAKARAVGIHMILATQRPDTKVITGTIKSNFPSRIAFKVASMIDSRTILDAPGANRLDDIALSLSALQIRIIAPMPGKGTIGIEVPNKNPQTVSMQSVIASRRFVEGKYELPVAMGKTITNEVFMFDLCKTPHLLVAGATGQGKSVGLNAIITSLLYKKHPSELKFVMVDPKMVEFSIYSKIERHYLAKLPNAEKPIVTEPADAVATLNSLVIEMEDRYRLLVNANVRNIKEYNAKFIERRLNPQKGHRFLPYIVAVVDEFADLIAVAGREIELPISRIAAKARAVGIHMILATQRPDTKVITGTIKSNFPSRIAFKVASMIDSRTILDAPGANRLIGRGDMLIVVAGQEPVRVQCAFVDTPEVEDIVDYIGEQAGFQTAYLLPDYVPEGGEASTSGAVDLSDRDPLFDEAARLIVIQQQGSTSLIQRKFAIGYNRAGRLMDQLEAAGIVGPFEGSKARQVLVQDEYSLEQVLNALK